MRKVVGLNKRRAVPAMAAKMSKAAASSRNGELWFRPRGDGLVSKPSDDDMLPPSQE
jgi:hypothetical protein